MLPTLVSHWVTLTIRPTSVAFRSPILGKHNVIHKTGKYITYCIVAKGGPIKPRPRVTRTENVVKFGRLFEIWERTDMHTYRHAHHNTSHSCWERSNNSIDFRILTYPLYAGAFHWGDERQKLPTFVDQSDIGRRIGKQQACYFVLHCVSKSSHFLIVCNFVKS